MLKISKRKDSKGFEFHSVSVTEDQLAQLAQLSRGQSLFGCVVMHSNYSSYPVELPLVQHGGTHDLVFSYQDICFGISISVKQGELPWRRGLDKVAHDVLEAILPSGNANVDAGLGGAQKFYTYPEMFLIRGYP